jgi:hypothetical protein
VNNFHPTIVDVMPPGFRTHPGAGESIPEQIDLYA